MNTTIRLILIRASLVFASLTVVTFFQNCSDAKFSQAAGGSDGSNAPLGSNDYYRNHLDQPNTNPDSCHTALQQLATDTRLLFVVDNSGSNAGSGGSDPNKAVRGGSIQKFFDDYKAKQNFWWGFIKFNGTTAQALINNGSSTTATFTNMLPPVQTAINTFMTSVDNGNTPYLAATDMARAAIQADTNTNSVTKWIVLFLSDGLPNPSLPDSALTSAVQGIVGLHPGQITFNTVYYGAVDPQASGRLQLMAQTGGGQFLDTNQSATGKSFLIDNIVTVPGTSCK